MTWLLDTNTISYLLRGHPAVKARFDEQRAGRALFVRSPVVDYEIRRYLLLKQATRNLACYEATTRDWLVASLEPGDWAWASALWAERHRICKGIAESGTI